ncbi:MAG: flagellar basal body P-ring formation protein FlgA [Candidatus Cloacimonetes bacterium]|nr:flagellar basal body P-ring formation protein FlgA [Candidatus Cloacimonadota bacterium]
MKTIHFIIVSLVFCVNLFAQCHFILQKQVLLPEGPIRYSSLGTLSCINSQQTSIIEKKMDQLILGRIFITSPTLTLKRDYLANKWNQFYPHIEIYLTGQDKVNISPKISDFGASDFSVLVQKKLKEHLNIPDESKIKILNPPKYLQLPESDYFLDFDLDKASRGIAKIKLFIAGKQKKLFFIQFQVLSKQYVLVSSQDLERGENLSPEFIHPKEVYISNKVKALPVQEISNLDQLKLKRRIKAGEVLSKLHIVYKDVIKTRQKLKGFIKRPSLQVELEVVALQKGKIGDKIMVLFPLTRKKHLATVINERQVLIEF